MRFMSFNKGLSIIIETPRRIAYPNGLFEDVPGKHAAFRGGIYETDDEVEIAKLKSHKLFNSKPGVPGAFWEYVPPRDVEAELAQKTAEAEELRKRVAELEASAPKKAADKKSQDKTEKPPVEPLVSDKGNVILDSTK